MSGIFTMVITDAGLAAIDAADGPDLALTFTEIAFGTGLYDVRDGSGDALPAAQALTALSSEVERIELTAAAPMAERQVMVIATLPGGAEFDVGEFGIFLDDGTLFCVASRASAAYFTRGASETALQFILSWDAADAAAVNVTTNGDAALALLAINVANLEAALETKLDKAGGTIGGDLIVDGNLTVNGNTTTVNSDELHVGDSIIRLNVDLDGGVAPSLDGGIEINRGSSPDVTFLWNEAVDFWELSARFRVYGDVEVYGRTLNLINASAPEISIKDSTAGHITLLRSTDSASYLIVDPNNIVGDSKFFLSIDGTTALTVLGNGDADFAGNLSSKSMAVSYGDQIETLNQSIGAYDFFCEDVSTDAAGVVGRIEVVNAYDGHWDGSPARHRTDMVFGVSQNSEIIEALRLRYDLTVVLPGKLQAEGGAKIGVQGGVDGTNARGIFLWDVLNSEYGIYCASPGAGKSLGNGTACAPLSGGTAIHVRSRINGSSGSRSFVWENSSEQCLMSLTADTGVLYTLGGFYTSGKLTVNGSAKINLGTGQGSANGLFYVSLSDTGWGNYAASSGALKSLANGTACVSLDGRAGTHIRHRVYNNNLHGFIWENSSEQCLMSLTSDTGILYSLGGFYTSGKLTVNGGSKISVMNKVNGGNGHGIFLWDTDDTTAGIYMAQAGAGRSLAAGMACAALDGGNSIYVRFRAINIANYGWLWENSDEQCLMSLTADTGDLHIKRQAFAQAHRARANRTITGDGAITADDYRLFVKRVVGAPTALTLPVGFSGAEFVIKDALFDARTNNITITGTGGELIDGEENFVINRDGQSITIVFHDGAWYVI